MNELEKGIIVSPSGSRPFVFPSVGLSEAMPKIFT
jgi:hypothetical protein